VLCGIVWPALSHHIPYMAHTIQLAICTLMSSHSVKGHTKSWEAHEHDLYFPEYESIDIGMSQILLKESNGRIYEVSAMRSGLAKIIENTSISRKFETTKTKVQMAENACCIDYSATRSSIRVH
jgi:hypothetical protein